MSIHKLPEFRDNMTNGNILLSAAPGSDGTVDGLPGMSVNYVELEPGKEVRPHTHDRAEVYVFLTGRAIVMAGEDLKEVTTGDVAIAAIGEAHAIKVIGNEPLRFYAFNNPPASSCPMQDAPEEALWKWQRQ